MGSLFSERREGCSSRHPTPAVPWRGHGHEKIRRKKAGEEYLLVPPPFRYRGGQLQSLGMPVVSRAPAFGRDL